MVMDARAWASGDDPVATTQRTIALDSLALRLRELDMDVTPVHYGAPAVFEGYLADGRYVRMEATAIVAKIIVWPRGVRSWRLDVDTVTGAAARVIDVSVAQGTWQVLADWTAQPDGSVDLDGCMRLFRELMNKVPPPDAGTS